MAKRGSSGLSRIIALDKPFGVTSHDVVNRCRTLFGERRVGHTGTLDPLATGVLVVCIGPATRLDAYLTNQAKRYRMGVMFGLSTTTDDSEGEIIKHLPIPHELASEDVAKRHLASLVGRGVQMPPIYSAIKVGGKKSYEAARQGSVIELSPREFEIYDVQLIEISEKTRIDGALGVEWLVEMGVSKGTYMRSIARDMGRDLQSAAYVSSLQRTASGSVLLEECVSLDDVAQDPDASVLDPLQVLGIRYAFARGCEQKVSNGSALAHDELSLNEALMPQQNAPCTCTTRVIASAKPAYDGELVGVIVNNRLKALYEYKESKHCFSARCVFSIGVERGKIV